MSVLHFPWIEAAIAACLLGAALVRRARDPDRAHQLCMLASGLALLLSIGGWVDFNRAHTDAAHDRWDLLQLITGTDLLVIDGLSAPLLPQTALVYLLTIVVTMRAKIRRLSWTGTLVSEALVLATLSCRLPWGVIVLLSLSAIPTFLELNKREGSARVFGIHMALATLALAVGWMFVGPTPAAAPAWAYLLVAIGVLVRGSIAPLHCWVTDLYENASFGTSLTYTTPMLGAYAAVRLLLPVAPSWILQAVAALALATAVYAAAMALVQREARRFFCYGFLSHSALILAGLHSQTAIGLTGALGVWLAAEISLAGFGLVLRALESRHGRLSLLRFHGNYEHTPELAVCFLLTGLASVGFPGTLGFLSSELLIDGAVNAFPGIGFAVVVAAALNGIAVMHAYFRLFTGARHVTTVSLKVGPRERIAVLTLVALVLGGSLNPQPGISARHHAAQEILRNMPQGKNKRPAATRETAMQPHPSHRAIRGKPVQSYD